MRDVRDPLDLAQLQTAKQGFILNVRNDRRKLHRAGCETVGVIASNFYRKVFFEESKEATRVLLDAKWGVSGWGNCGICGGIGPSLKPLL